jgi:hypothetical protein
LLTFGTLGMIRFDHGNVGTMQLGFHILGGTIVEIYRSIHCLYVGMLAPTTMWLVDTIRIDIWQ